MRVSSAEFMRRYGTLADRALSEAITITRNGRDRLVVVSADEYLRLLACSRRAVSAAELSNADLEAVGRAEVPPGYEHLDAELGAPRTA